MKKLIILFFLLFTVIINAQTSVYSVPLRTSAGAQVTSGTVELRGYGTTTGTYSMTHRGDGIWTASVPVGTYSLYYNGTMVSSEKYQKIFIGEDVLAKIAGKFDSNQRLGNSGIQNDAVDKTKIAADVAGDGLDQDTDGSIKIKYDDTIFTITADKLDVADGGIDGGIHIEDSTITADKFTIALWNLINAAGGASITNNPDDESLENKSGSTIGLKNNGRLLGNFHFYPEDYSTDSTGAISINNFGKSALAPAGWQQIPSGLDRIHHTLSLVLNTVYDIDNDEYVAFNSDLPLLYLELGQEGFSFHAMPADSPAANGANDRILLQLRPKGARGGLGTNSWVQPLSTIYMKVDDDPTHWGSSSTDRFEYYRTDNYTSESSNFLYESGHDNALGLLTTYQHSRGAVDSRTALQNGDMIHRWQFRGTGTSSVLAGAYIDVGTAGTWTNSSSPGWIGFYVTKASSTTPSLQFYMSGGVNKFTGSGTYEGITQTLNMLSGSTSTASVFGIGRATTEWVMGLNASDSSLYIKNLKNFSIPLITMHDNNELIIKGSTDNGAYDFQVNGTSYFGGKTTITKNEDDVIYMQSATSNASALSFGISTAAGYTWLQSNKTGSGTALNHRIIIGTTVAALFNTAGEAIFGGTTDNGDYKGQVNGNFFVSNNIKANGLPSYADDAAAGSGGLSAGQFYKTATGELRIKL